MLLNFWRNIIKFDFTILLGFKNFISLFLALIGFVIIVFLRIPESKTKTSIGLSKFSFLLMNFLYLDAQYHDKLIEEAEKLEPDKLYQFMLKEINKTKDSPEANQKLLSLFRDFKLVDYCKSAYLKSSSDRKLKLIEDFSLLPMSEINNLLIPILSSNSPVLVKIVAIRTLAYQGLGENPYPILLFLSSVSDEYNHDISEILFRLSQSYPNDKIKEPSKIDPTLLSILSNRFLSLMLQPKIKQAISGAYMVGYLCLRSASAHLVKKLAVCEEKELEIAILKALRKVNDGETANDLIQFLTNREVLETEVIREYMITINSFGLIGNRLIQSLTTSSKPILKIMAMSFLNQS